MDFAKVAQITNSSLRYQAAAWELITLSNHRTENVGIPTMVLFLRKIVNNALQTLFLEINQWKPQLEFEI